MSTDISESFLEKLHSIRQKYGTRLTNLEDAQHFIERSLFLLFPHFCNNNCCQKNELSSEARELLETLHTLLTPFCDKSDSRIREVTDVFANSLPEIHEKLWLDAEAILKEDPAAKNIDEVILAYPGFFAIAVYRLANVFYLQNVATFPRLLSEFAHKTTGIDIHPGATIGRHFVIDHGTGTVVGETTNIHDSVKLYQGVTLGALSVEKSAINSKRHPTIEDGVVIYSNATILGGETVIGKNSIIGGNVWLTSSIPENSVVYHKSDLKVKNAKD